MVNQDLVLLLKRQKEPEAGLGMQVGAMEFGDTAEDAVKRELK